MLPHIGLKCTQSLTGLLLLLEHPIVVLTQLNEFPLQLGDFHALARRILYQLSTSSLHLQGVSLLRFCAPTSFALLPGDREEIGEPQVGVIQASEDKDFASRSA